MPLDYRLAMAAPQERFGTLKDIMAIGQLHDQDRQQQQARIDADQQRQADLIVQQTLQKHADRPEDAILELRQRGFAKPAMALETHLSEIKQKAMAARKTELEATKIDLENRGVHPDQGIKQIETELKLIAARDPKVVLEGIANTRSQEELDHWLNAAKFVLPRGSEALIATFPTTWTPEVPTWAAHQAMGAKEVANNALQTRGQNMTAATAAAGQETTRRGQDMTAATAARRLAQGDGGGSTAATQALARTVFNNPALYGQMTDTNKDKIAVDLEKLGFDFAKYGGKASGGGRPVLAGDARLMTDYTSGLNDANLLKTVVTGAGATGAMPALGAAVPNWVTQMTGFGEGAKQRNAVIARVKQVIGKTLEGGVLRKEDEEKYKDILPTIGDAPEVAASKIDGLIRAIEMKRQTHVESLTDAGFNTAAFQSRFNAPAPADKAYTGEVRQSSDGRLLGKVNGQVVEVVKSGNGYQVK